MLSTTTTFGKGVDEVFIFIASISVVLLVLITFFMIYFIIKYNRKKNPPVKNIKGNMLLETLWTVIPLFIVLVMFYYGWYGFRGLREVPPGAMEIKVYGQSFFWTFHYPSGKKSDILRVPVGTAVKLNLHSKDVVHSFYIPAFRIKEDAVPGQKTYTWFREDKPGTFDIYCAEYCGTGHSTMITKLEVMPKDKFEEWLKKDVSIKESALTKEEIGKKLLKKKGCMSCHSTDGSKVVGPSLKGFVNRKRVVVTGGKERTASGTKKYFQKSLYTPNKDVVKGFPPIMPPAKGNVSQKELNIIYEYLKTLK